MPVLHLPDDTALPARVDAFVFEQDTEYILRADLPVRYPAQSLDRMYRELDIKPPEPEPRETEESEQE